MTVRTGSLLMLAAALWLGSSQARADGASVAEVEARLAAGSRAEQDRARDAGRKPAEVVVFLGVEPGMTVIDLIAAGGYYTEVLSWTVGPEGKVYSQNNKYVLELRDGANDKALTARLANDRLANVERLDREMNALGIEPGSVDVAITALNFHDIYNSRGPEAAIAFLESAYAILAPGGVLGIIDHAGGVGDDKALHRIDETMVIDAIAQTGFEV
ncbi:MAG: SAM-dependent methyltransferase [Myxococcales bacterium]|nr:MAG: SAM-dependent methyltransferase [Myxococcales bacterium]